MNVKKALILMKKRQRQLNKRIKEESGELRRLRYKSRSVRQDSRHGPRKAWFTDRRDELALSIDLLEGGISEEKYVKWLAGDELDMVLSSGLF